MGGILSPVVSSDKWLENQPDPVSKQPFLPDGEESSVAQKGQRVVVSAGAYIYESLNSGSTWYLSGKQ
jgi:hypothetical protein